MGLHDVEDFGARIPVVGSLFGLQTNEQRDLLRKQRQLAEDAERRQAMMTQARMQALGQQMLAFAPRNQMMAEMFGPEAAFTPQQMGDMTANPMGVGPGAPSDPAVAGLLKRYPNLLEMYEKNPDAWHGKGQFAGAANTQQLGGALDHERARREAEAKEAERRRRIEQQFKVPLGPQPLQPTPVAPPRKY